MRLLLAVTMALLIATGGSLRADYDGAMRAIDRDDIATALREARAGAEQGDARAQRLLALFLMHGKGTRKDAPEALRWLSAAAEQGDALAQRMLGDCHLGACGLKRDSKAAFDWYGKAAAQNDAPSQYMHGVLHLDPAVGRRDPAAALRWVKAAAEQGHPMAQVALGGFLFRGIGIAADPLQAYVWASLAARAKEKEGTKLKKEIATALTPEQRKDGDKKARAWRPTAAPQPAGMPEARPKSTGTGFVVSDRGHVVTNEHVVRGCRDLRIRRPDESSGTAAILASSRSEDLSLLQAEMPSGPVAPFRAGKDIRAGDAVIAFGFPLTGMLSSSGNLTLGNVSALSGFADDGRFLQVSTPIQPGNSGGPLLDMNGRVVGVTTSSLSTMGAARGSGGVVPQNVNFAIKGEVAAAFLQKHGVTAATVGGAGRALKAADIGDRARRFTVRIECMA